LGRYSLTRGIRGKPDYGFIVKPGESRKRAENGEFGRANKLDHLAWIWRAREPIPAPARKKCRFAPSSVQFANSRDQRAYRLDASKLELSVEKSLNSVAIWG
jgi:hypothetical protein